MSQDLDRSTPSALAYSLSSLVLGLVAGYFIGSGSSIGLFSSSKSSSHASKTPKKSWPNSYDVNVHVDSSDEELMAARGAEADDEDESDDEDGDGKELSSFSDNTDEVKLVLVVRTDLGMTKGKIAAQCGHATLACYKYLSNLASGAPLLKRWESNGQPKIAVQSKSQEELETMQAQAMSLGLCAKTIRDAGRTQIEAGSMTVLGILGPKSVVDQVTGGLKLL